MCSNHSECHGLHTLWVLRYQIVMTQIEQLNCFNNRSHLEVFLVCLHRWWVQCFHFQELFTQLLQTDCCLKFSLESIHALRHRFGEPLSLGYSLVRVNSNYLARILYVRLSFSRIISRVLWPWSADKHDEHRNGQLNISFKFLKLVLNTSFKVYGIFNRRCMRSFTEVWS